MLFQVLASQNASLRDQVAFLSRTMMALPASARGVIDLLYPSCWSLSR